MFRPTSPNYDEQFPQLGQLIDGDGRHTHAFKVPNPTDRDERGNPNSVTKGEAILNWQSENAISQNRVLSSIGTSMDALTSKVSQLDSKVDRPPTKEKEKKNGDSEEEEETQETFMVFPKENPLSSFLKEQCKDNQMLVKDEASDSISEEEEEEESEATPEESEGLWETEDSYPLQEIHVALEDACMKRQAIREVLKGDKSIEKACKRPELYIKCSSKDKTCSCPTKKKKHYKKWKMSKAKSMRYSVKKWKYPRKKRMFGKKYKSSRCYMCNQQGHFAKNCPRAPKQGVKIVQQLGWAGLSRIGPNGPAGIWTGPSWAGEPLGRTELDWAGELLGSSSSPKVPRHDGKWLGGAENPRRPEMNTKQNRESENGKTEEEEGENWEAVVRADGGRSGEAFELGGPREVSELRESEVREG
ncbi:hypothetical protein CRG98_037454 [Punica granatum]|uniref:CCHC-type domain-containing protein n=1 Tax=Punica granatum TaxID=22663 RepID=A0A2I0IDT2_PUNGR|nr:hypothetical protein CRG98_037454 [Punica granatum]